MGPILDLLSTTNLRNVAVLLGAAMLALAGPKDRGKRDLTDRRIPVWTTEISRLVKEPRGGTAVKHETEALAFSPDGKYLAVTITHHQRVSERKFLFNTHLLIVDVRSPEMDVRQFDLSEGCGVDLTWNENGDALLVCGTLVRLADGTTCDVTALPSVLRESSTFKAFWLDSVHVVRSNTGEILDISCRCVGTWHSQLGWQIAGAAASKGWVLLDHSEGQARALTCQYSIMDRDSQRTLTGWPTRKSPCAHTILAAGAEALCFDNGGLHCRAINGGKGIHLPGQVRGYRLNQAAISSPRVIAEKWTIDRGPWWSLPLVFWIPAPLPPPLPRERTVFDLRSGKLTASWNVRMPRSTSPYFQNYLCALSANGELLAESGDGMLELYRLTP